MLDVIVYAATSTPAAERLNSSFVISSGSRTAM
jgi:hypothetical protein